MSEEPDELTFEPLLDEPEPEPGDVPEWDAPPVGVSVTVPVTGRVRAVQGRKVAVSPAEGVTVIVEAPEWEYAQPEWWPSRFGDHVERPDTGARYLCVGEQWVNQDQFGMEKLTDEFLYGCRILNRSN